MTTRLLPPLLACAAAAVFACSDSSSPELRVPGIHITSGAPRTDTIGTIAPLDVYVTDSAGHAAPGRQVVFTVAMENSRGETVFPLFLHEDDPTIYYTIAFDTTDVRGRAHINVGFSFYATNAELIIEQPQLGFKDTARFVIRPGRPAGVTLAPWDSMMFVGGAYHLRATQVDRGNNPLDGPVSYRVLSGPVTVGSTGDVAATAVGRVAVTASSAGDEDTVAISVVPQGQIATLEHTLGNSGFKAWWLMNLDGSQAQKLAGGFEDGNPVLFAWTPDGSRVGGFRNNDIIEIVPGQAPTVVTTFAGSLYYGLRYSRDGQWMYFAGPSGMWRVHRDGSGLAQYGPTGSYGFCSTLTQRFTPNPARTGNPVVYLAGCEPYCIVEFDMDTQQDRLVNGSDCIVSGVERVAASPTDDVIAYMKGRDLHVIGLDGSGDRLVASNLCCYSESLDFSPDGKWVVIAFEVTSLPTLVNLETGMVLPLNGIAPFAITAWRP